MVKINKPPSGGFFSHLGGAYMPSFQILITTILAVSGSFVIGFTAGDLHRGGVDKKDQEIQIARVNEQLFEKGQLVQKQQSHIDQLTEEHKNAIQKQSADFINSVVRNGGLLKPSPGISVGANTAIGISSQKLRFSVEDAVFLNQFATECAISESERNAVIQKYQAVQESTK